jgi:AraC-like DNA-binding protein
MGFAVFVNSVLSQDFLILRRSVLSPIGKFEPPHTDDCHGSPVAHLQRCACLREVISEMASASGFTNQNNLLAVFRKHTGLTSTACHGQFTRRRGWAVIGLTRSLDGILSVNPVDFWRKKLWQNYR